MTYYVSELTVQVDKSDTAFHDERNDLSWILEKQGQKEWAADQKEETSLLWTECENAFSWSIQMDIQCWQKNT